MDNDSDTSTGLSSTASLQTLCMINLIDNLDHYSPELLACIPPVLRYQLFLCCPIVDICSLELTNAFDGIDSEKLWGMLYDKHWERSKCDYHNMVEIMVETKHEELSSADIPNREKYFILLTTFIFCAERLLGSFVDDKGYLYTLNELPQKWVEKYCPTDFVNYLVSVATSKLRRVEKEDLNEEKRIKHYCPTPQCHLDEEEIRNYVDHDDSQNEYLSYDYVSIMTKNQHFPARHMHITNNKPHLGDEEAIRLLMDECNYYPNNIVLCGLGSIRWQWSKEDVCGLLMRFFCQLKDIHLSFIGDDDTGYTETVVTCCFSSPALSSVFVDLDIDLADLVISVLTSQHPTLTQPILKKLGILKLNTEMSRKCKEILSCQNGLYKLELQGELCDDSDLLASIIDIVSNPNFCKLSLDRVKVALKFITQLLTVYLVTPSSHPQELALHSVQLSKSDSDVWQQTSVRSSSEELALMHKSLQWTNREWLYKDEFPKVLLDWLLSFQPLVLNSLFIDLKRLEANPNVLETIASNPAFCVQNLKLKESSLTLSEEYLEAILKRPSLKSLELGSRINSRDLILMANALRVQNRLGTLENLTIKISEMDGYDIESFLDVIFTLPQISCLSVKLYMSWTKDVSKITEAIYQCWQKNGHKKLRRFCFDYVVGESYLERVHCAMDTNEMQLMVP